MTHTFRKLFAAGVMLCCLLGFTGNVQAASNPSIVNLRAGSVTASSARVDFTTNNPSKLKITNCGVQIRQKGASNWTTKTDNVASRYQKYAKLNSNYIIGSGKEVNYKLAAGKTYEYRGFCRTGGKYYYSGIKTFSTPGAVQNPSIKNLRVSGVTDSSARVDFTTSNPGRVKITSCGVQIRKNGTNNWTTKTDTIAAKNQTLATLNSWYFVGAGQEVNLTLSPDTVYQYRGFCVYNGKAYYSGTATFRTAKKAAGGKKLSYDKTVIKKIGYQPKNTGYCSVYALAYARAVRGWGYSNPLNYWTKGVGASWGKGGMISRKYETQQEAMRRAYNEICAGRPAIIYVYGPNAAQHYVTVIGYKNGINPNKLSPSSFIIIDPGNGYGCERDGGAYTGMKRTDKGLYQVVTF